MPGAQHRVVQPAHSALFRMGGMEFGAKELPVQAQGAKAMGDKMLGVS